MGGVQLTTNEAAMLEDNFSKILGGKSMSLDQICKARESILKEARATQEKAMLKEMVLKGIEKPAHVGKYSKQVLPILEHIKTITWAVAGAQAGGEVGMHIIGCSFVGCIGSLGGGTVNTWLYNPTGQVPWTKWPPVQLMVALAASVVTFFLWPYLVQTMAERQLHKIYATAVQHSWWEWAKVKVNGGAVLRGITESQFVSACEDPEFGETVAHLLEAKNMSPAEMFEHLDKDDSGTLDAEELERLVKMKYDGSTFRYMLDSVSVSVGAVTGTAAAISLGLHPLVCVVASVTVTLGGTMRDIICKRDVGLGTQSMIVCTAAGSSVYVLLRQLSLSRYGYTCPFAMRIFLAGGTTFLLRMISLETPLLSPMHAHKEERQVEATISSVVKKETLATLNRSISVQDTMVDTLIVAD